MLWFILLPLHKNLEAPIIGTMWKVGDHYLSRIKYLYGALMIWAQGVGLKGILKEIFFTRKRKFDRWILGGKWTLSEAFTRSCKIRMPWTSLNAFGYGWMEERTAPRSGLSSLVIPLVN